ncbi:MAG: YqaJ viral recombinase family protein [Nanoarchaeota archaeon]|jgi:putative phage-type endonuclease|nr:YqaJ viral recombinase family protein [Nanoarchaeota archaeon]
MKIYKELIQGTDEWFSARENKMTASNAQSISANGKGLETYIYSMLAEKFSQNKEFYTNADMERGNELEPQARDVYEINKFVKVEQVGFIEMDEFVGCSPDGLVGDDGMIEIKCMNDKNHFKFIIDRKIKSAWMWQMQMQLLVSRRKWVDLVAYNKNFDNNILTIRVEPDLVMQEKLIVGIAKGKTLINEITKNYEKASRHL